MEESAFVAIGSRLDTAYEQVRETLCVSECEFISASQHWRRLLSSSDNLRIFHTSHSRSHVLVYRLKEW